MQRFCSLFAVALSLLVGARAQETFSQRLTPEERRAAGLDQLSPEQLAALDRLVQRDRDHGAVPAPAKRTRSLDQKGAASANRDAGSAAAAPKSFGLPADAQTPKAIVGRLVGEYRGWNGSTMFRLQDGQIWIQEDHTDQHDAAPRQSPEVKIEKSMFGGYKLTVEGDRVWVRVRRVQ